MDSNKYDSNGLPNVTQETADTYLRDLAMLNVENRTEGFGKRYLTELFEANAGMKYFFKTIQDSTKKNQSRGEWGSFLLGIIYTYELLRRQAESIKLDEEIKS